MKPGEKVDTAAVKKYGKEIQDLLDKAQTEMGKDEFAALTTAISASCIYYAFFFAQAHLNDKNVDDDAFGDHMIEFTDHIEKVLTKGVHMAGPEELTVKILHPHERVTAKRGVVMAGGKSSKDS